MKKLILLLICMLIPSLVLASPFLVCDPQAGVTSYQLTGPGWVPTTPVPAQTDGSLKLDIITATNGVNSLTVKACVGVWCSDAVPFDFTKPVLVKPTGIGLAK